jgi:hypothetical protein
MANKGPPFVDRHALKSAVGWLENTQQGKVCSFTNANPAAHAHWVVVETRSLRGHGQPVVRCTLLHNAIEAWETLQKNGGWKQCPPKC